MKTVLALLVFSFAAFSQGFQNFAAAGVSFQPGGTPSAAGTALYAKQASGVGTYAFTVTDALPTKFTPFTVTNNTSAGIAQRVVTVHGVEVFIPTAAGISYSGTNTGWSWSTGALALIPLKGNTRIAPNVRVVKSSVNGNSGYQLIAGVLFGWGF
jgi:hypothetical protein